MQKLRTLIIVMAVLCGLTVCTVGGVSRTSGVSAPPAVVSGTPAGSPSAPPAETVVPEPELQYTFSPYVLPPDAAAYIGNDLPYYRRLVDAVLNRQTSAFCCFRPA